jgi:hypothetical protein
VTQPMEANQRRRTAERASTQSPGLVSYWLIAKYQDSTIEVLTIRTDGKQETLPVFSSEEEAEISLRFGGVDGGWRVRESSVGELVSVLCGPCAGVKKVALDPSPEMLVEGTVGLVSLLRESFVNLVMARRSRPLRLGEPEELGSTDGCLGASPQACLGRTRQPDAKCLFFRHLRVVSPLPSLGHVPGLKRPHQKSTKVSDKLVNTTPGGPCARIHCVSDQENG